MIFVWLFVTYVFMFFLGYHLGWMGACGKVNKLLDERERDRESKSQ